MKKVFLPLRPSYICGHNIDNFMLVGREEHHSCIERNGVMYMTAVEHGPCRKCNEAEDKRVLEQIDELES